MPCRVQGRALVMRQSLRGLVLAAYSADGMGREASEDGSVSGACGKECMKTVI